jgi:hypothetical protein
MSLTTVLACSVAIGLVFAVFYALRNGYDVKAVMKIAFIGFTFEAKDKRVRKPTKSGAPEA